MSEIFSARNLRLQKYLRWLAALFLLAVPVSSAAQATLDWELVNPFRFISNPEANLELRTAYDRIEGEKTAFALERKLQEMDDVMVDAERANGKKIFYSGWFSRLAEDNYAKTCWNARTLKFRNEGDCKDYVHPTSHKIKIWIENSTAPAGASIEWFLNNEPISNWTSCRDMDKPCIEFPLDYDPGSKTVSVKFAGLEIASRDVTVVDKLIVALGDSYGSGEGNPDIPAHFVDGRTDIDIIYKRLKGKKDFWFRREPMRDKDSEVSWLDPRCHRSMYSYSFKTALQLALSNPQQAVTYVSYACSGAVTENIFKDWQKAKEPAGKEVPGKERNKIRPQLDVLKELLKCTGTGWKMECKKDQRQIDYLLLSTGGNDIGFADYVAYILTGIKILVGKKPDDKTPDKIIAKLKKNYNDLRAALASLNIKNCGTDNCKRLLLTLYPQIMQDENKKLCEGNRGEFDIPFGPNPKRRQRIMDVRNLVFKTLTDFQKTVNDWTRVESHIAKYESRGFCAQEKDTSNPQEMFRMPIRYETGWDPFEPVKYRAFGTRARWIRLPVDSKLTTDQVLYLGKFKVRFFYIDVRSNVMHPTAEGLAATADANVSEISNIP
jgi:hypothetical protein